MPVIVDVLFVSYFAVTFMGANRLLQEIPEELRAQAAAPLLFEMFMLFSLFWFIKVV